MNRRCQAKTWMQLQKQQSGGPVDPEYGCTRTGKHVIDGHLACTHHYNKPSPWGWNDGT